MDRQILIAWGSSVLVYVFMQRTILNRVDRSVNLVWQMRILGICIMLPCFLFGVFLWYSAPSIHGVFSLSFLFAMILLSLLSYILGVYSNFESSISLKLFSLIIAQGESGITAQSLKKLYPVDYIISRRISRLRAIGQIRQHKGKYRILPAVSAFSLRTIFGSLFTLLFPPG